MTRAYFRNLRFDEPIEIYADNAARAAGMSDERWRLTMEYVLYRIVGEGDARHGFLRADCTMFITVRLNFFDHLKTTIHFSIYAIEIENALFYLLSIDWQIRLSSTVAREISGRAFEIRKTVTSTRRKRQAYCVLGRIFKGTTTSQTEGEAITL